MISQSLAANVDRCASAMPAANNAMLNQHLAVPVICALAYQKTASISNRTEWMRVCADAKPNELTSAFSLSLTRHIILLKTGNVFAFSTCSWRLGCVSTGGFAAVVCNRSFPGQKISKMLRLARNQCGSASLSRGLDSCAGQE